MLLRPKWYLLKSVDSDTQCIVSFKRSQNFAPDSWILGQPFLRAYYTVFDKEKSRIGVVPRIYTNRIQTQKDYRNLIIVVVVCVGTPLIFTLLGLITCACRRCKRQKEKSPPDHASLPPTEMKTEGDEYN